MIEVVARVGCVGPTSGLKTSLGVPMGNPWGASSAPRPAFNRPF